MEPIKSSDQAVNNEIGKCVSALKALAMTSEQDVLLRTENNKLSLMAQIKCDGDSCGVSIYCVDTNNEFYLYPRRGNNPWDTPNSEIIALLSNIRNQVGERMQKFQQ